MARAYAATLRRVLNAPLVAAFVAVLVAGVAVLSVPLLRQELTPPEDRGAVLLSVQAPQGVALEYTNAKMREIEALVAPLRAAGEVRSVFAIAGMGGQDNRGFMVVTLAPWEERARTQQEIAGDIQAGLRGVIGVRAFAIQPNSLGIRGAGQGLSFALVGDDYGSLSGAAKALVEKMEGDGRFGQVRLGYDTTQPQLFIEIDRERAEDLGCRSTGWARPCRRCWTGGRWGRCSWTTTAMTSGWCRPPIR